MPSGRRVRRVLRDWAVAVLGIAALGVAAFLVVRQPPERAFRLTISAGSARGARHLLAQALAEQARRRGVFLDQQPTAGSEEALDRVDSGALHLALVQGGLDVGPRRNVRQVTALGVEPLHLLVKEELHPDVSRHLGALRGRVVNLGEPESGTHALASAVLQFLGLAPGPGGYTPSTLSYAQLLDATDRNTLPDAVFTVSLPPSPIAKHLAARHRFRLVALPFASAFALDEPDDAPPGRRIVRSEVADTLIPAFTYGVDPPVPAETSHTLGTRLLLVAHKDVSPEAIGRLLDVALTTHVSRLAQAGPDPRLVDLPSALPAHDGTRAYLERNKPLIAEDVIDLLEKEVSIAGVVAGGLFFLWQWLRRQVRRRHDLGFGHYLRRVLDVERRAQALESSAVIDLAELLRLQDELGRLRSEALERFVEGELGGEELMSGFLAHAGDARGYLTRLILHVREHLEDEGLAQGRPARALWQEALAPTAAPPPEPTAAGAKNALAMADPVT